MDNLLGLFDAIEPLLVGAFAFTGLAVLFGWIFERWVVVWTRRAGLVMADVELLILFSLLAAAAILYCLPLFMMCSGDRVADWFERHFPRLYAAGEGLMLAGLACIPVAIFFGWLFQR